MICGYMFKVFNDLRKKKKLLKLLRLNKPSYLTYLKIKTNCQTYLYI